MADSHTAFIGSIPEYYDQYLGPLIFEEYAIDLAQRISVPSGGSVLETAAGTGIATHHLEDTLPQDVNLVVTDLNEAMLEHASSKFVSQNNLDFQTADATNLAFPEDSFDATVCQFSLMFFPDKQAAVEEVRRVLKPGGQFVFSLWDSFEHNHLVNTIQKTLTKLYPENPPPFFEIPYGYFQIDPVKELLGRAGFKDINISVLPSESICETARDVALGYILGTPVCTQIAEREQIGVEEVVDIVEQAIEENHGGTLIKAKMQAIVFEAYC